MARETLDKEATYTWKSAGNVVREGCKILWDSYNGFCYTIEDLDKKSWIAYESELTKEVVEEVSSDK